MSDAVSISRLRPAMITLRGDLADAEIRGALAAAGPSLPETRRFTEADGRRLCWMSTDELLLALPREGLAETMAALAAALEGTHHLLADVSDARAVFRIEGRGAREVLAKGAPVDLSPAAFGPGDLRRTRLGQVAAAFMMTSAAPETFELVCFRSVALHVETWLETASAPGSLPGVFQG